MKYMYLTLALKVLLILCVNDSFAFNRSDSGYWDNIIEKNSLNEIATLINNTKQKKWPVIQSLDIIKELPKETQVIKEKHLELAKKLIEKIKYFERNNPIINESNLGSIINMYTNLSQGIKSSGGYVNLVLTDSINRIALTHLASFLVKNPSDYRNVHNVLRQLNLPGFNIKDFASVLEEAGIENAYEKIKYVRRTELAETILKMFGLNYIKLLREVAVPGKLYTANLLINRDIPALLWRMAETDLVAAVHISGLIEFLKRGGEFSDVRLDDVRKFNKIMGNDRKLFKSELLYVRRLDAAHIRTIIDDFGNKKQNNFFYIIALE